MKVFRSPSPQTAWLSDERRLADSNRCNVPLAADTDRWNRSEHLSSVDPAIRTNAAASSGEALHPIGRFLSASPPQSPRLCCCVPQPGLPPSLSFVTVSAAK